MKKKKRKVKKRNILKILSIIILLILIIGVVYFIKNKHVENNSEVDVENYAKINNNCNIYDINKKKIGTIEAGNTIGVVPKDSDYYNIVGTDYYISRNDVSIIKYMAREKYSKYVDLGIEIVTKDSFILFNDNDNKLAVYESSKLKTKFMDNNYYYINLGNIYYKISKDDVVKENKYTIKDKTSDKISVINFNNISSKCDKYECYTEEDVNKLLDYIIKNGYYTISVDDFKKWNNGNINLKEKAVLLISSEDSELVKTINSEYNNMINVYNPKDGLTFLHNNIPNKKKTNISSLNNYNVRKNTSIEDFKLMMDGKNIIDKYFEGTSGEEVAVLNYHFFYDLSRGQTDCHESICLDVVKFRKQLDYLRDNGYTTLTMNQFVKWAYGEADVPEKSVLITIDDGAYGTGFHNNNVLIPVLEEYKMHATLFLISGWWDINNYKSSYLEIQSHTHDMHKKDGSGTPQLIGKTYDEIINDLNLSINTIGNNETFCYPFYEYDNEAIKAIQDLGFKVAFAGGRVKATRNSNKFTMPRYPIHDSTSMDEFIKMVS